MNDTDLCTGDSCPIKDKCLRNQIYKRLLNNPDGELHWHVEPQYKDEKCANYLSSI